MYDVDKERSMENCRLDDFKHVCLCQMSIYFRSFGCV
jgi:hypothetical protein